ncbi:MAG: hypothetical protein O3B73_10135 [bacterium]|nr:hypothetical protein [bacterium]
MAKEQPLSAAQYLMTFQHLVQMGKTDRDVAILIASLVERALRQVRDTLFVGFDAELKFPTDEKLKLKERANKQAKNELIGIQGSLSTARDCVNILYATGYIGPETYHDTCQIQTIRNTFAHRTGIDEDGKIREINFDHPKIVEITNKLRLTYPLDDKNQVPPLSRDRFITASASVMAYIATRDFWVTLAIPDMNRL